MATAYRTNGAAIRRAIVPMAPMKPTNCAVSIAPLPGDEVLESTYTDTGNPVENFASHLANRRLFRLCVFSERLSQQRVQMPNGRPVHSAQLALRWQQRLPRQVR